MPSLGDDARLRDADWRDNTLTGATPNDLCWCLVQPQALEFKRLAGEPMMKSMGRTKTRPVPQTTAGVPVPVDEIDQTHEIPAVSGESEKAPAKVPSAVPQQVIPIEETVPVQSCIERTLLHEVLRQQSAEKDEDHGKDR
jgi:hypothetical protein